MNVKSTLILAALVGGLLFAQDSVPPQTPDKIGIHVAGVWTISVFDAEGREVSTRTFHNDLVGEGMLTGMINAEVVCGGNYLVVEEISSGNNGPCGGPCNIGAPGLNSGITFQSTNLTRTTQGNDFETLVLSGSVTATSNHNVNAVTSWLCVCNATQKNATQCAASPDSCGVLTQKTLTSPITVTSGQIIQVTLEITFS